jgi:hypothetical protein
VAPREVLVSTRKLIILLIIVGLLTGSAQAITITGGDSSQSQAVLDVVNSRPNLTSFVLLVWPDFHVRLNYGGHAWDGYIDVNKSKTGTAFTYLAAHEWSHEVQLAADAAGKHLDTAWLQLLRDRGYPDSTWVWNTSVNGGRYNPWECFAENLARAYWSPYYTGRTTPNTGLVWLSRADMAAFLASVGIQP